MPKKSAEEFADEVERILENPTKFEGLDAEEVARILAGEQLNEPASTNSDHREQIPASLGKTKLYTLLKRRGVDSKQTK